MILGSVRPKTPSCISVCISLFLCTKQENQTLTPFQGHFHHHCFGGGLGEPKNDKRRREIRFFCRFEQIHSEKTIETGAAKQQQNKS